MSRKKREKIIVLNVLNARKRGLSWRQISAEMGPSPSALWRAVNQPGRTEVSVPAGYRRSTYLSDAQWELLWEWGQERGGISRARVIGWLIDREAEFRASQLTIEEA